MYLMNYIKPSFLMNKLKTESVLRKEQIIFIVKWELITQRTQLVAKES